MTAEGFTDIEVTEPLFQTRTENVLTKEASTRFVVRQPSYRNVRERILTRPAHERLSVSAPQFSTVTETIQTSAPHLVWKRGNPGELQRQGYVIQSTAAGRLRAQLILAGIKVDPMRARKAAAIVAVQDAKFGASWKSPEHR